MRNGNVFISMSHLLSELSLNFEMLHYLYYCCSQRSRSYESDDHERGACEWCEYALIITLATILLIGVSALTIFWIFYYREGYGWADDQPEKQFNLHPTLMVAGFITFSGFCEYMVIKLIILKIIFVASTGYYYILAVQKLVTLTASLVEAMKSPIVQVHA